MQLKNIKDSLKDKVNISVGLSQGHGFGRNYYHMFKYIVKTVNWFNIIQHDCHYPSFRLKKPLTKDIRTVTDILENHF